MMLIQLMPLLQTIPDITVLLPDASVALHGSVLLDVSAWSDAMHLSPADWSLLAQQFDTDVFAGARNFFNNFIESGQVWALIIGVIIGYLLRGLTSYG